VQFKHFGAVGWVTGRASASANLMTYHFCTQSVILVHGMEIARDHHQAINTGSSLFTPNSEPLSFQEESHQGIKWKECGEVAVTYKDALID